MSRYQTDVGVEGQYEPGSHGRVLRNLQNIKTIRAMQQAEHDALLLVQGKYLRNIKNTTRFTAALLCQMHRDWLGTLYPWAGKYRTVEMQKGNFRWPPAYRVAPNMAALETGLLRQYTPCLPDSVEAVALRVAQVHAEFLLIHPFREGNGRMARWLADLMIAQAGLPAPYYGFEGRGSRAREKQYLLGVIAGYKQNYLLLTAFFAEAIRRRLPLD